MHVVFGAAGALGAAIVQNLSQQNKTVRAVVHDVGRARKVLPSSAEIVVVDASKPDSIKPAFHNVSVIYHCVNVPYDKWTEVMPLVTDNILAGSIDPFFAYITDSLHNALVRLSSNELQEMPVVSNEDNRVLGIVTISDLVKLYDKEVEKVMKVRKDNGSQRSESSGSNSNSNPEQNLKKL